MSTPLVLRVHHEPDAGWHVSLGEVGARVEVGRLPPAQAAAVVAGVADCLSLEDRTVLLVAGDDVAVTQVEEQAGRHLAQVLESSPAVARVLARALGAAEARGGLLPVLVDAAAPELRDLPWECLASDPEGPPLEGGAGAVVARMGQGGGLGRGGKLRPVLWCADDQDAVVCALVDEVRLACERAGLEPAVRPEQAAPAAGEAGLVFLIGHGEAVDSRLRVLGPEGGIAPGTLAHSLRPWLEGAPLVVLLICEGGLRHPQAPDGLVDRLLLAGAAAVVASEVRLAAPAAASLVGELVPVLAEGGSVAEAVAAARRAVRGLALPYPDARWWRLGLTVGHARALDWRAAAELLPPGWRPGPTARPVLARALALACAHRHGWLGMEHLALALAELPPPDKVHRFVLNRWLPALPSLMSQVESAPRPKPVQTPRLLRLRARLPDGFEAEELAAALADSLPAGAQARLGLTVSDDGGDLTMEEFDLRMLALHALQDDDGIVTPDPSAPPPMGPWGGFEVVGGPEDGRVLVLRPGELLGRAHHPPQADHLLFQGEGGVDPWLSRRHLRVEEGGAITLLRRGWMLAGQQTLERPEGRQQIEAGDVVALTRVTWLVALSAFEVEARQGADAEQG